MTILIFTVCMLPTRARDASMYGEIYDSTDTGFIYNSEAEKFQEKKILLSRKFNSWKVHAPLEMGLYSCITAQSKLRIIHF
jgi:hypothetical protein